MNRLSALVLWIAAVLVGSIGLARTDAAPRVRPVSVVQDLPARSTEQDYIPYVCAQLHDKPAPYYSMFGVDYTGKRLILRCTHEYVATWAPAK